MEIFQEMTGQYPNLTLSNVEAQLSKRVSNSIICENRNFVHLKYIEYTLLLLMLFHWKRNEQILDGYMR